jgi:hypothetical protein
MASGAFSSVSRGWLPGEIEITRIGQLQFMFVLYGVGFMLMSAVLLVLYARVLRMQFDPPLAPEDRAVAGVEVQAWGILAGMGAASALLALLLPPRHIGFAVWIYSALAVIMPVMGKRWERTVQRAAAAAPSEES